MLRVMNNMTHMHAFVVKLSEFIVVLSSVSPCNVCLYFCSWANLAWSVGPPLAPTVCSRTTARSTNRICGPT